MTEGICRAFAQLTNMPVTRPRVTGKVRIGVIVSRVMYARRGRPLISVERDPHLPALQFQRTARSPAGVTCNLCRTPGTTSPSLASAS